MGRYAETTRVPVARSRAEIERTLARYGADAFGYGSEGRCRLVTFRAGGRHVRIDIVLPEGCTEQQERQKWRALLLTIKAKLEAVESGIATFEEEFMAYVLLPSGETVGEWAQPQLRDVYSTGQMPSLLPGVAGALPRGVP